MFKKELHAISLLYDCVYHIMKQPEAKEIIYNLNWFVISEVNHLLLTLHYIIINPRMRERVIICP